MSSATEASHAPKIESTADLAKISLGALGVVYGDIGTSPLYAIRECFTLPHGVRVTRENVLGVESLFFWAMTLVVAVKYLAFIMRADNRGEGGILALLALLRPKPGEPPVRGLFVYVALGLFGTALLYGDGIITPAITVLGAIEGLGTTTTFFFSANVHKIADGGWFPLSVGAAMFTLMTTWRRGRELLGNAIVAATLPLDVFMADV